MRIRIFILFTLYTYTVSLVRIYKQIPNLMLGDMKRLKFKCTHDARPVLLNPFDRSNRYVYRQRLYV